MRHPSFRPAALLLAVAFAAACEPTTAPPALDVEGLQADLSAANAAVSAPATASLGALGPQIDQALAGLGGGLAMMDLPAALLKDPDALLHRADLRTRALDDGGSAALIPAAALGKTFEYSTETDRYVAGQRTGAPQNGVRFILYAVNPVTDLPVEPLVETGYADLTRTVANETATARVEVYNGGELPSKVLDYAATVSGTIVSPSVLVAGFARNAADSLAFTLNSTLSLANQTLAVDWLASLPTRGLSSHVQNTITGGANAQVEIDGLLTSTSGHVRIAGVVMQETGGTLLVAVNDALFATIQLDHPNDETPTILNAAGQPPTPAQQEMLGQILHWFRDALDLFEGLLAPVGTLLDIAF